MNTVDLERRAEMRFHPSSLLQSKKKVSGEISKEDSLDILLTDLEQSSFSLLTLPLLKRGANTTKRIFKITNKTSYSGRVTRFSPIVPSVIKNTLTLVSRTPILRSRLGKGVKLTKVTHLKISDHLFFFKKRIDKTTSIISKVSYLFCSKSKLNGVKSFLYARLTQTMFLFHFACVRAYKNYVFVQQSFAEHSLGTQATHRIQTTGLLSYLRLKQNAKNENIDLVNVGDYVHCGDKIGFFSETPIVISESGKILKISQTQVTIQKMQPVLFYSQAEIHVENNEWVKRGTPILTLTHQTLVTGDIIQGIPRIEQLFEASTATPPGAALQDFGSPSDENSLKKASIDNYLKTTHSASSKSKDFAMHLFPAASLPLQQNNFLESRDKKYDFAAYSTTEEEPMFLHKTLQSQVRETFREKWDQSPLPVAVRKSLEEIQQIIVESIQKVYISQGVLIADKHIEIIVRQMTSKAQIFDGGSTGLLIDEILSLQQIENANISTPGQKALYLPIVMGLTRAALSSDSFVSAASFQETTRVLSRDAVAGKTDFLRGLKEKVIIGDLIDAGTGLDAFYIYSLFSKNIFENKFREILNRKITHKTLKKLVLSATK